MLYRKPGTGMRKPGRQLLRREEKGAVLDSGASSARRGGRAVDPARSAALGGPRERHPQIPVVHACGSEAKQGRWPGLLRLSPSLFRPRGNSLLISRSINSILQKGLLSLTVNGQLFCSPLSHMHGRYSCPTEN
jgi:hypothetical protein